MKVALDSSAIYTMIGAEVHSAALKAHIVRSDKTLVACELVVTEVLRTCLRNGTDPDLAYRWFDELPLIALDIPLLRRAGAIHPSTLRSLDALHIVAAQRVGADEFVTYDRRQADAATSAGLLVAMPGVR